MSTQENKNEVSEVVLSKTQNAECEAISDKLAESHEASLSRDKLFNEAQALMFKLLGLKPDYYLLKAIQAKVINMLVNKHKIAITSAEVYFSNILKQLMTANPKFVKPSKNTKDSERVAKARADFEKKYQHESLENIKANLQKVNRIIGQAYSDNAEPKEEDIKLQKELKKAETWKQGKADSNAKTLQDNNIKKLRDKIDALLKIQTGVSKKGNPIFSWSVVNLDFVYRCLQNQEAIKKFLADK